METIHVDLAQRSYDIHIGAGLLDRAGEYIRALCPKAFRLYIVTDDHVAPLYLSRLSDSLEAAGFGALCYYIFPAGESTKSARSLSTLWEDMAEFGLTRTDAVIALGGGVVGDLAGFAAATMLRGVDLIQIPTTLLSQVDSSVGGKVAIDLEAGKNLAGCFWQPKVVLMDPETLTTLDDKTFSDGMAEVIKYGCIWSRAFFDALAAHPTRGEVMADIDSILYTCCDIKRKVVEEDERDTGVRMILNFGHTVGHAFEKMGGYQTWTHGQAVAAGMCTAARLGVGLGFTPPSEVEPVDRLCAAFGLPTSISLGDTDEQREDNWKTVVETIGLDKKGAGDHISLILMDRIGRAIPRRMARSEVLDHLAALYGRA